MSDWNKKLAASQKKLAAGGGKNKYIADPVKALELISMLVRNSREGVAVSDNVRELKRMVNEIFKLFSKLSIPGETGFFRRFMMLCDKAREQEKIRSLKGRTIISLGGRFSSGKSSFINAFSGMGDLLPVEQTPTTSIPTYIIADEKESFTANSYGGFGTALPKEAVEAISHDFANAYKIQLAAFVESIVITTATWNLPPQIALLDTPGYNKAETGNDDVRAVLSDRMRAHEQLKGTDYLIWLADITNGTMTQDDFEFINHLGIANPILVIFNKADKVDAEKRREILENTRKDLKKYLDADSKCFGVAAYSSSLKREYDGDLIATFFSMVAQSGCHCNDIYEDVEKLERDIGKELSRMDNAAKKLSAGLASEIRKCNDGKKLLTKSLVNVWSRECRARDAVSYASEEYDIKIAAFNSKLKTIIG